MSGTRIVDRRVEIGPEIDHRRPDVIIRSCSHCSRFVLCSNICDCSYSNGCHPFRVVFTDGACFDNGKSSARAGAGIAFGNSASFQRPIPITEGNDPGFRRTNQRAELIAAIAGLELLEHDDNEWSQLNGQMWTRQRRSGGGLVVATDSEYVVKGITDWLHSWRDPGGRIANGARPVNLDLFDRLDSLIVAIERKGIHRVGFWHIPREYNRLADHLSKEAADNGEYKQAMYLDNSRSAQYGQQMPYQNGHAWSE